MHQALAKFEAGEDRIENVSQEVADIFAWIVAIWQLAMPQENLQEEFISHYYNGCPVCEELPCKCLSRKERRSGIVSLPQLRDLHDQIAQLGEVLGSRGKELGDIKKSIEQAIQSQNEQVAVQAIAQT